MRMRHLANFRRNLWAGKLFRSFAKHPPETYQEADNRALEQVDIEKQLQIKVKHDEARLTPRPKKEVSKPAPAKRFQNQPLNQSSYRPPPLPPYQERYPATSTTTSMRMWDTTPLNATASITKSKDW